MKNIHQNLTLDTYRDEQHTTTSASIKRSPINSNYTPKVLASDKELLTRFKSQIVLNDLMNYNGTRFQPEHFHPIAQFLLNENQYLSYGTIRKLHEMSKDNSKKYFSAKAFLSLNPNSEALVPTIDFVRYVHKAIHMEQLLLQLLKYTSTNENILTMTSQQMQYFFLQECLPLIDPTHEIDESFYEFYTCTATTKFYFYLDSLNSDSISIHQILTSHVMNELQQMIHLQKYQLLHANDQNLPPDVDYNRWKNLQENIQEKLDANWFSVVNAINIYTTFLNLDVDRNGLLSIDEIVNFSGFGKEGFYFTKQGWTRIFEELVLFAPFELDYRGFVKLVLALDDINHIQSKDSHLANLVVDHMMTSYYNTTSNNVTSLLDVIETHSVRSFGGRSSKSSYTDPNLSSYSSTTGISGLKFFWNILDFDRTNRLTPRKIQYFYEGILQTLEKNRYQVPALDIIIFEIYDLIGFRFEDPSVGKREFGRKDSYLDIDNGPSFEDLLASKQAVTVIMMLLDIHAFWRYDNRESLIASSEEEDDTQAGNYSNESSGTSSQSQNTTQHSNNSNNDSLDHLLPSNTSLSSKPNNSNSTGNMKSSFDLSQLETFYDDEDDEYSF